MIRIVKKEQGRKGMSQIRVRKKSRWAVEQIK